MKSKVISYFLLAGAVIQSSCTNEGDEVLSGAGAHLRITTEIQTRAVIESNTFSLSDQIGVFAGGENNNVLAIYDYQWYLMKEIPLTESYQTVYAYYPYTENCDGWAVPVDLTPDAVVRGQADYLYGASVNAVNAANPDATIHFNHALARITFAIKRGAGDVGDTWLSKVALRNAGNSTNIAVSGYMNVETGDISNREAGNIAVIANCVLNRETAQNVDILVMPTALSEGDAELALTIDGSLYVVELPAVEWIAGQQYTYPVTINRGDSELYVRAASTF